MGKVLLVIDQPWNIDNDSSENKIESILFPVLEYLGKDDYIIEYIHEHPVAPNFDSNRHEKIIGSITNEVQDNFIKRLKKLKYDCVLALGQSCNQILSSKGGTMRSRIDNNNMWSGGTKLFASYNVQYIHKNPEEIDNSLIPQLEKARSYEKQKISYTIYDNLLGIEKLVEDVVATKVCCFDFETTGLEWFKEDIVPTMISISYQPGHSHIIPLFHEESTFSYEDIIHIFCLLSPIFSDPTVHKINQNIKFDIHWLKRFGIEEFHGRFSDTMLMHQLLDENKKHGLKDQVAEYFTNFAGYESNINYKTSNLADLAEYAATDTDLCLRLSILHERELLKIPSLYKLYRNLTMFVFWPLLNAESRGAKIDKQRIEKSIIIAKEYLEDKEAKMKAVPEVVQMEEDEFNRIKSEMIVEAQEKYQNAKDKFEVGYQKKLSALQNKILDLSETDPKYSTKVSRIETKIEMLEETRINGSVNQQKWFNKLNDIRTGNVEIYKGINFRSTQQMQKLLYDYMKFPPKKDRDGEKRTTEADHIKTFNHKFIDLLIAQRSISKMLSTYYEGILNRLDSNSFLHTDFRQSGTKTGRLSSRNPNFQNIPQRTTIKDKEAIWALEQVKTFFCNMSEDHVMLQADFSQAELRVIANYADEPTMKKTYLSGIDIHVMTATQIYNIDTGSRITHKEFYDLEKTVQKKYRTMAKGANFGWVYKSSVEGYVDYLKDTYGVKINLNDSKNHRKAIFGTYKKLTNWHNKYEQLCRDQKYVETIFGRRRRLPDIDSQMQGFQNQAIRNAINSPIQGSSGEYTLFCIALLDWRLPKDVLMFNTVHDSVFYYVPKDKLELTKQIIKKTCANAPVQKYFSTFDGYYTDSTVPMEMDFELSETTWSEMKEI